MSEPGEVDNAELAKYVDRPVAKESGADREELILDLSANLLAQLNKDTGIGSAALKDMLRHQEAQLQQLKGLQDALNITEFYRRNEATFVPKSVIVIKDAYPSDKGRTPTRELDTDITQELMYLDSSAIHLFEFARDAHSNLRFNECLAGAIKTEPAVPPDVYISGIDRAKHRLQTKNILNVLGARNVLLGGELSGPKFTINIEASESCAVMPGCSIDSEHGGNLKVRNRDGQRGKVIYYGGKADFKFIDAEHVVGGQIAQPSFATGSGGGTSGS